jgi:hypothetical protein
MVLTNGNVEIWSDTYHIGRLPWYSLTSATELGRGSIRKMIRDRVSYIVDNISKHSKHQLPYCVYRSLCEDLRSIICNWIIGRVGSSYTEKMLFRALVKPDPVGTDVFEINTLVEIDPTDPKEGVEKCKISFELSVRQVTLIMADSVMLATEDDSSGPSEDYTSVNNEDDETLQSSSSDDREVDVCAVHPCSQPASEPPCKKSNDNRD